MFSESRFLLKKNITASSCRKDGDGPVKIFEITKYGIAWWPPSVILLMSAKYIEYFKT